MAIEILIMNETIQTLSNVGTAVAAIFAAWQLYLTHRQAKTAFEDTLAREYRELANELPAKVFYDQELAEEGYKEHEDEFYHYFDLSNGQIFLRQVGRVTKATWVFWRDGIRTNLKRAAFAHAWKEISERASGDFAELRRLISEDFKNDPRNWRRS